MAVLNPADRKYQLRRIKEIYDEIEVFEKEIRFRKELVERLQQQVDEYDSFGGET